MRATNASGDSGYTNEASATTLPPDTTGPTVSITAPSGGATVSGSVAVQATASDDSGSVAGVQFKLDGANLGAEDTAAPFSVTWDAATASAGSHTLTAVARDAAGNTTTSGAVTVTVNNPPIVRDANSLTVAATSPGDVAETAPLAGASGGDVLRFDGDAAGDFVTFNVSVAATNTYNVSVRYHKNAFRGIAQLAINNGSGFVNRGAAQDLYTPTASAGFVTVDLGSVTLNSGTRAFRFTVTGKNAASNDFQAAIDTLTLTPQ